MTEQHLTTPPPELVRQWQSESPFKVTSVEREDYMIDRAARWAADQELKACCEWLDYNYPSVNVGCLRTARRPKPPSLKAQALDELDLIPTHDNEGRTLGANVSIIRRALEALPND